jgi:hypothetical protein
MPKPTLRPSQGNVSRSLTLHLSDLDRLSLAPHLISSIPFRPSHNAHLIRAVVSKCPSQVYVYVQASDSGASRWALSYGAATGAVTVLASLGRIFLAICGLAALSLGHFLLVASKLMGRGPHHLGDLVLCNG